MVNSRWLLALFAGFFCHFDFSLQAETPKSSGQVIRILPMGDSLTWGLGVAGGYRELLEKRLTESGVTFSFVGKVNSTEKGPTTLQDKHCEGYPGFVINQGQPRGSGVGKGAGCGYGGLFDILVSRKSLEAPVEADVVLLLIGTNDVAFNAPDTNGSAVDRLKGLLQYILDKQPKAQIFLATLPPIHAKASRKTEGVKAYNAALLDPANGFTALPRVTLVDLSAAFLKPDGTVNGDYYPPNDAIHPNKAGYDAMAEVWFGQLSKYLSLK
jgi:lysophospholipase L1-like esterase